MVEAFSERLITLRKEKGWSKRDLAKVLNVSHSTINRWENGLQTPNMIYIYKIATLFDVTSDYLIGLQDF